jgi:L-ascorbate metabolism protein UlaG (beta-lactamase superfamily)
LKRFVVNLCFATAVLALAATAAAQTAKIEVLWLGQSTFRITTPGGKVIVTDPWLTTNPRTPAQYKDLDALGKVDVLLVSHAHFDHIADAPAIAKKHSIRLWGPGDMNQTLTVLGVLPAEQLPRFNKSGRVEPAPGIKVTATHAEHSSTYVWRNGATGKDEVHVGGEPVGFIIELENGFRIWHTGDTGVFGDMKWIGEYYKPDLVLVPIGGNFTMDPVDAAFAIRELIRPKAVIPMHYGSNPLAKGTAEEFAKVMAGSPVKVIVLNPGEKAEF